MKKLLAAATIFGMLASMSSAFAAGAIAVAEPNDVARDGYSSGISYNFKTDTEAEDRALRECQNSQDAPPATRQLCKLIRTFKDQCVAVALDPQAGTPGAGWAIADTLAGARRESTQRCEETAGRDRQGECRVTAEGCDGRAK
jgi:hypothetical protein